MNAALTDDRRVLGLDRQTGRCQSQSRVIFTEKLGTEGANAEDMSYRVGVPPLGEHRHADDTFDVFTELAGLADSVHYFAEQVFFGQLIGVAARKTVADRL